jgi:hypothetical protein
MAMVPHKLQDGFVTRASAASDRGMKFSGDIRDTGKYIRTLKSVVDSVFGVLQVHQ